MDEQQDFPLILTPEETKRRERGGTAVVTPEVVELTEADEVEPSLPDAPSESAPEPVEATEVVEALEAEPVEAAAERPGPVAPEQEVTIVRPLEPDPSALLKSVEALVQAHARLTRERDEARQRVAALEGELAVIKKDDRASQLEERIAAALKALGA